METFSASLVLCAGIHRWTVAQRPETRTFDVFFDLRLNKRLSKQSEGWWFETPSRSLWRHRNDYEAEWLTGASVSEPTVCSDNCLSHARCKAIIWTNAGLLFIGLLGTNFSEILIAAQKTSLKKMYLEISTKCRLWCLGLSVLTIQVPVEYICGTLTYSLQIFFQGNTFEMFANCHFVLAS